MTKQPKALRLAAHAEANASFGDMSLIAAELRRLHEVNAELLEALKGIVLLGTLEMHPSLTDRRVERMSMMAQAAIAKAAIAKAEGDQA